MFADDYAGDITTTGVVNVSGQTTGVLDSSDSDWFAVTLAAGESLDINSPGIGFPSASNMSLHDSSGNAVSLSAIIGPPGYSYTYTSAAGGTYFVGVNAVFTSGPPLNYSFYSQVSTDDYAADITTTALMTTDGTGFSGTLESYVDQDWIAVDLVAGETVIFSGLAGAGGIGPEYGGLYDSTGAFVSGMTVWGHIGHSRLFDVATTGRYYLEIGQGITPHLNANYTITANTYGADVAGDTSTTGVLTVTGETQGWLETGSDSDWYAFTVSAGEGLRFTASGGASLDIFDSNGSHIESNPGHYYFATAGTYYLGASSFSSEALTYTIATTAMPLDIPADISTSAVLTIDGETTGTIEFTGDEDWFRFSATAGETFLFTGTAHNQLALYDEYGNSLGSISGSYTFNATGDYFLSYSLSNASFNSLYRITTSVIPLDVEGDNTSTETILLGNSVAGVAHSGYRDSDWYGFTASAGQVLQFEAGMAQGYNRLQLNIYDAAGNFVNFISSSFDYSADVWELLLEIPTSGSYFVEVVEHYDYGQQYDYALSMSEIADDYTSNSSTTGSLSIGGSVTGAIEYQNDRDWIGISLTQGDIVRIDLTSGTGSFSLVDENGNIVANQVWNGSAYVLEYAAADTATYYVNYSNYTLENYSFAATALSDDFGNDVNTNGTIAFGQSVVTTQDYMTDSDWLAFDAVAGEAVYFSALDDQSTGSNLTITVMDSNGIAVAGSSGVGFVELAATLSETGTMYVRVSDNSTAIGTTITVSARDNAISGDLGPNQLLGTTNGDTIIGLGGNDTLMGLGGDDYLSGGSGADILIGGAGADHMDGGADNDYVFYSGSSAAVQVNLETGLGVGGDRFYYTEINGVMDGDIITDFSDGDYINLSPSLYYASYVVDFIDNNAFTGVAGQARYEISGADTLLQIDTDGDGVADETLTLLNYGGALQMTTGFAIMGYEVQTGTEFNDTLIGTVGIDTMSGLAGNDVLYGFDGADIMDGGDGYDLLYGYTGDDVMTGGDGNDQLHGNLGDDQLMGGLGDDYLSGGDGNDFIVGGAGADTILGGAGFDTVSFASASMGVIINVENASSNAGDAAGDTYVQIEQFIGSDYADQLYGSISAETLEGGAGNDLLLGRDGDDTLRGDDGADRLVGGVGDDALYGGTGADIFAFAAESAPGGYGADIIHDFEDGVDMIELIGLSAYRFDQLKIIQNGSDVQIFTDAGYITIMNSQVSDFDASDFIFGLGGAQDSEISSAAAKPVVSEGFVNTGGETELPADLLVDHDSRWIAFDVIEHLDRQPFDRVELATFNDWGWIEPTDWDFF